MAALGLGGIPSCWPNTAARVGLVRHWLKVFGVHAGWLSTEVVEGLILYRANQHLVNDPVCVCDSAVHVNAPVAASDRDWETP